MSNVTGYDTAPDRTQKFEQPAGPSVCFLCWKNIAGYFTNRIFFDST